MGLVTLLFKPDERTKIEGYGPADKDNKTPLAAMFIEATTSESHDSTATPTENPVEDGSDVSDHISVHNDELTIEGFVSETPLRFNGIGDAARRFATAGGIALAAKAGGMLTTGVLAAAGATNAFGLGASLSSSNNPVKDAYNTLRNIQKLRQKVSITTRLNLYKNMVCTSLKFPVDAETGRALRFTATFKHINIVSSEITLLPKLAAKRGARHSAASKSKLGQQATSLPDSKLANKGNSILLGLGRLAGLAP